MIQYGLLLAPVLSQQIETIPASPSYHTLYERNVELLCRADKPIDQCHVRLPGPSAETFAVDNLPGGVKRIGDDSRGECGVRLGTFTTERVGKFVCILTIGGQQFEAAIELRQRVAPRPAEVKISKTTVLVDGGIRANQLLKARCTSRYGLPVANLTWFLDSKPINESLLKPAQITTEMQDGKSLQTIQQEVNLFVTPEQNGMALVCVANHPAFKTEQRNSFPLNVKFAPEEIPHIHIDELPASGSATVNITIHANPQPVTRWTVNGRHINEGESVDVYQAYIPRPTSANGEYRVLLKNNDCSKERASLFTLEATNALGTQTYVIKAVRVDGDGAEIPLFVVLLSAFLGCSHAIQVITEPAEEVVVVEGQKNVNLLCLVEEPMDFCIVKLPGAPAPFAASDKLPAPVEGITFYGLGWSKGSCGITIDTIKPIHDGPFECTVSVKGQTYKGQINIALSVAPEPPVIEVASNVESRNGEFEFGKKVTMKCVSRNGWPGAKLSWYLDGVKLTDDVGAEYSETSNRRTTVQQIYRRAIAVEDNRKQVTCRAEHTAYPGGFMETSLPIKLKKVYSNEKPEVQKEELKELVKPKPPQIMVSSDVAQRNGAFKVGSNLVVQCVSKEGNPPAGFLWFLNDQLIYEGLSAPFISKNFRGNTVQQTLTYRLKQADDGKVLICKARHPEGSEETRLKISTYN
uniref:Ig-like domain-containing protein n=1 Tax=Anopheles christyi TaxID=43041 RepID=A0A182JXR4_9DIPT